ncbi:hypothetical protein BKP45_11115 [Anaerobacillus alkalidiazotrophicus]|uniref:Multidrug ABC transporter permease n=1 Tax=Anaerobacillus alkalidiazotrophicus TaxID=472963 RepID=A0A1S2M740_9BACI|nr:hypothetical protein [Anaerobacillus alkalidiazotrophicus]OIJ18138.1 hypothetical protein BKP45_16830 [Anaerobacillus alkalidiazotrophicus]OIJ19617.1 hypothetical protein BKP45_11115 [Anaerobacillus alkalidiazotrophicus]
MPLKTLLFNRGVFIENTKNIGWIGIAYFLSLFFAVPLQILMIYTRDNYYRSYTLVADNLFRLSDGFQLILLSVIPVLLALVLFRYVHVKLSTDYIHSLPIKREALYHQHVLFGLGVLVIPVFFIGLILLIISSFIELPHLLSLADIATWMGTTILFTVFIFMAAVFAAMFTGMSVLQGVLTYILLFFPAGVTMLLFMNVKYSFYGIAVDYYLSKKIEKLIPFVRASQLGFEALTGKEISVYFLFIVVFYVIALLAYCKRKVEVASQAIAFKSLEPVFLYGVTFCAMLLGGLYFGETQNSTSWLLFGYVFASIIGYFVALMIVEKTWRVLTKWKGYGIYALSICVLAIVFQFDITGFEKRIPAVGDIERIYFAPHFYLMDGHDYYIEEEYLTQNYYYQDEQNKENIVALHEQIIKKQNSNEKGGWERRQFAIAYELTSGKQLVRHYQVPVTFLEEHKGLYGAIIESDEHKYNVNSVLRITDTNTVDKITIISNRGTQQVSLNNRSDISEFHQILQTEIMDETYDDLMDDRSEWSNIEYLLSDDKRVFSSWKKSHDQIEAWLQERDLVKQARLTADDIDFAVIVKRDERHLYEYMRYENDLLNFEKTPGSIRIEEFDELEECLLASSWNDSGKYVIAYYYEKDTFSPLFETIDDKHVPEFIRKKLN